MTRNIVKRIGWAAVLVPVAIGALTACGSDTAGHAAMGGDAAAANSASSDSSAEPSTDSTSVEATTDTDHPHAAPAPKSSGGSNGSNGSGGAVNQGSQGAAAGAGGIGTQSGAPDAPAAKFVSFSVGAPYTCVPGDTFAPVLYWKTENATGVAISVDKPDLVGDFGMFDANGTLTLPKLTCAGAANSIITHQYDAWTLGESGSDHRTIALAVLVAAKVPPVKPTVTLVPNMPTITVKPTLTIPPGFPTMTVKPTLTIPPNMPTMTVKPTLTIPPGFPTMTVKPPVVTFPAPIVPLPGF